jgi:hypothetical protein
MSCRTYMDNGQRKGLPSRDVIRAAIEEALARVGGADNCFQALSRPTADNRDKSDHSSLFVTTSLVAAMLANFCCILPIVFALTGLTVIGASALFAAWRPYLLTLTFGLLGLGFYSSYRPVKADCGPNGVCARPLPKRSGRLMLWLATAAVILFAAFPYFSGPVAEFLLSQSDSPPAHPSKDTPRLQHASLAIQGYGLRVLCHSH